MEIAVSIVWQVVVDCEVNALDVNSSTENIGGYADAFVELFELFVAFDTGGRLLGYSSRDVRMTDVPLFLADSAMDCDAREIAFSE